MSPEDEWRIRGSIEALQEVIGMLRSEKSKCVPAVGRNFNRSIDRVKDEITRLLELLTDPLN